LSVPSRDPLALGIPIASTPHTSGFPVQRIPLALRIPKRRLWCRYGYFVESTNAIDVTGYIIVFCNSK